jgi:hypothetical protein
MLYDRRLINEPAEIAEVIAPANEHVADNPQVDILTL